nr:MAG TPA: hypothetical protein [Caudoviricetes sp.]
MTAGQNSLYVTDSGVFKTVNGVNSPIGAAVFG